MYGASCSKLTFTPLARVGPGVRAYASLARYSINSLTGTLRIAPGRHADLNLDPASLGNDIDARAPLDRAHVERVRPAQGMAGPRGKISRA